MSFTVRGLSAIEIPASGRSEYWDESTPGFGVRVSATGAKTWIALYRAGGRKRRYTIGRFDRISLADARAVAKEVLATASKGGDPAAEKANSRKAETFAELAKIYITDYAIGSKGKDQPRKRSWAQDEKMLEWYVFPDWRNLKAKDIKRSDVKALLRKHTARGAPIVANRVLSLIRKMFNYWLEEEIGQLEFNPCVAIRPPTSEKERQGQRVLSLEEIRKLWTALDVSGHREAAAIIKLRLLILQRGREIRMMEWNELDFETMWWTIPGTRTKNKLAHRVPITQGFYKVISQFRENGSQFVFASPVRPDRPIENIKDPFYEIRRASAIVEKFVMRDLRRTGSSNLTGQLGIPRFVVGTILNHVERGITRVYDRHSYDPEKLAALNAWDDLLTRIVQGESAPARVLLQFNTG